MSDPTPPAVSDATREAVARWFSTHFNLKAREALRYAGALLSASGPIASEIARLTGERDAARELASLTWTAPDIDAVGRWAEDRGAAGIRDRMNRLFRRATAAEEQVRQLLNDADRVGQDHATVANDRAEAAEAETARLRAALEDLRPLSEAAAPGKWSVSGVRSRVDEPSCVIVNAPSCPGLLALPTSHGDKALEALRDAKFAVAAVNFVRAALSSQEQADA